MSGGKTNKVGVHYCRRRPQQAKCRERELEQNDVVLTTRLVTGSKEESKCGNRLDHCQDVGHGEEDRQVCGPEDKEDEASRWTSKTRELIKSREYFQIAGDFLNRGSAFYFCARRGQAPATLPKTSPSQTGASIDARSGFARLRWDGECCSSLEYDRVGRVCTGGKWQEAMCSWQLELSDLGHWGAAAVATV